MNKSKSVIEKSFSYFFYQIEPLIFEIDDIRLNLESNSKHDMFIFNLSESSPSQSFIVFNNLFHKRNEILKIRVNTPRVEVIQNLDNKKLSIIQTSLLWPNTEECFLNQQHSTLNMDTESSEASLEFIKNVYEILFEVTIDAMSTKEFLIQIQADNTKNTLTSQTTFFVSNFTDQSNIRIIYDFEKM